MKNRKLISMLTALALTMSLSVTAFAEEVDGLNAATEEVEIVEEIETEEVEIAEKIETEEVETVEKIETEEEIETQEDLKEEAEAAEVIEDAAEEDVISEKTVTLQEQIPEIEDQVTADALEALGYWRQVKSTGKWWFEFTDGTYAKDSLYIINGQYYYFDKSGYMVTGWRKIEGVWCYFQSSGAMYGKGWHKIGGVWYYFICGSDSKAGWMDPRTDFTEDYKEIVVDGVTYCFKRGGALYAGWLQWKAYGDYCWNYYTENGMVTGWKKISNKWYYFDPKDRGFMYYDGLQSIGGKYYYFKKTGELYTGWVQWTEDGPYCWNYYDDNGEATGWRKIDGKWYYFDASNDNFMVYNCTKYIGGTYYTFNKAGEWVK